jgi:methyl-accepting chemotaxis protein
MATVPQADAVMMSSEMQEERVQFHFALQRTLIRYICPMVILIFIVRSAINPCWQYLASLVSFCLVVWLLMWAQRIAQKGQISKSLWITVCSVMAFSTFALFIIESAFLSSILVNSLLAIYASLFSRRLTILAIGIMWLGLGLSEVSAYFSWVEIKRFSPGQRLFYHLAFSSLLLPAIGYVLERNRAFKNALLARAISLADTQAKVIGTAEDTAQTLASVVQRIQQTSEGLQQQTQRQAQNLENIQLVFTEMQQMAERTLFLWDVTLSQQQATQQQATSGVERLQAVRHEFEESVKMGQTVQSEFRLLAEQSEGIDRILLANREINAQIKLLALNASLQAAKAGEQGKAFGVVALELKNLIQQTESTLQQSRNQLEYIRKAAHQSATSAEKHTTSLISRFQELDTTGEFITEMNTASLKAAGRFAQIAEQARLQQRQIENATVHLNDIQQSFAFLHDSVTVLSEGVVQMNESQKVLRQDLGC